MKQDRIKGTAVSLTAGDKLFYFIVNFYLIAVLVVIFIPMWSTITLSFRSNTFIGSNMEGMFLPPWLWSTAAYRALLGNNGFLVAFSNSLQIFIVGVITALFFTIPMAYGLSIRTLPGRRFFNILILIPYVFSVGLIPGYFVVRSLGLTNTLASIYLPLAISTYNCLIMRGFFEGIPDELKESARIDGASEITVLI
jgi:putative aldouronate transport system permease protein